MSTELSTAISMLPTGLTLSHPPPTLSKTYHRYPTFAKLAGVSPTDDVPGFPGVDGMDMWPYLTGQVQESPRHFHSPQTSNVLIITQDRDSTRQWHKRSTHRGRLQTHSGTHLPVHSLVLMKSQGSQDYDFWQGPEFPNTTKETPCQSFDCKDGCLFNIKTVQLLRSTAE